MRLVNFPLAATNVKSGHEIKTRDHPDAQLATFHQQNICSADGWLHFDHPEVVNPVEFQRISGIGYGQWKPLASSGCHI